MIQFSLICTLEYVQVGVSSFPFLSFFLISYLLTIFFFFLIWLGGFDSGFRNNKFPKGNLSVKPFLLNIVLFVQLQSKAIKVKVLKLILYTNGCASVPLVPAYSQLSIVSPFSLELTLFQDIAKTVSKILRICTDINSTGKFST